MDHQLSAEFSLNPRASLVNCYDGLVEDVGSLFASAWWLDAVAPGRWRPHVVTDDRRVVAAWPATVRPTRWGDVLEGAPLTPFLGPLMRLPENVVQHWAEQQRLLEALLDEIGQVAAIDARCHPEFDYWTPLRWHGFAQTTTYTWRLEDISDTEAVFARTRENVRREVRKAAKRGVTVGPGSLEELLASPITVQTQGEPPRSSEPVRAYVLASFRVSQRAPSTEPVGTPPRRSRPLRVTVVRARPRPVVVEDSKSSASNLLNVSHRRPLVCPEHRRREQHQRSDAYLEAAFPGSNNRSC